MTVYLLPAEPAFPPVEEAEPDGLIAIGGDLSSERLVEAYKHGIFPWFMEKEEVFWFSPDPRMILFPNDFKQSASLQRTIKTGIFQIRADERFGDVIRACAMAERQGQDGTWISKQFIDAYTRLHHLGFAHSFEAYHNDELVGGLYGVSVGAAFFGESMFFRMPDASKVAFAGLVEFCLDHELQFIDCQVETNHLRALGAVNVSRKKYLGMLETALQKPTQQGAWFIKTSI